MDENWMDRVVDEKDELDEKIMMLEAFNCTDTFNFLHMTTRNQLKQQLLLMKQYSELLGTRIDGFDANSVDPSVELEPAVVTLDDVLAEDEATVESDPDPADDVVRGDSSLEAEAEDKSVDWPVTDVEVIAEEDILNPAELEE